MTYNYRGLRPLGHVTGADGVRYALFGGGRTEVDRFDNDDDNAGGVA